MVARILTVSLLLGLLAGCGYRGPLYLPDKGEPAQQKSGQGSR